MALDANSFETQPKLSLSPHFSATPRAKRSLNSKQSTKPMAAFQQERTYSPSFLVKYFHFSFLSNQGKAIFIQYANVLVVRHKCISSSVKSDETCSSCTAKAVWRWCKWQKVLFEIYSYYTTFQVFTEAFWYRLCFSNIYAKKFF